MSANDPKPKDNKEKAAEEKPVTGPINEAALANKDMTAAERERALGGRDPQLTYPSKPPDGYAADGSVIDEERHRAAMEDRRRILNPQSALPAEEQPLSEEEALKANEAVARAEHEDLTQRNERAETLKKEAQAETATTEETGTEGAATNANVSANTPANTATTPTGTTGSATTTAPTSTGTPTSTSSGSTT